MTNTILAIDLGKFNSVLCHFDPDTREASVHHRVEKQFHRRAKELGYEVKKIGAPVEVT